MLSTTGGLVSGTRPIWVSAKKNKIQGGAAYTLVVGPHDKPWEIGPYQSQKDRATLEQVYEYSLLVKLYAHLTYKHTNPHKTYIQYRRYLLAI